MSKINWKALRKNIPNEITIGPKKSFKTVWAESVGKSKNGRPHYGETDFVNKEIKIYKNLSNKLAVLTYWHEVLHTFKIYKDMHLREKQVSKFEKKFHVFLELYSTLLEGKK